MIAINPAIEWLIIYLMSLQLAVNNYFPNQVNIEFSKINLQDSSFTTVQEPGLAIYCIEKNNNDTLISWHLLPYQSFVVEQESLSEFELLTVTEHAVIYEKKGKYTPLTDKIRERFHEIIALKHYEKEENTIPLSLMGDSCSAKYKKQYCLLQCFNGNKNKTKNENDLLEHKAPMECMIFYNAAGMVISHQWTKKRSNARNEDKCWNAQENQYTQTLKNHLSFWLQPIAFDGQKAADSLLQALKMIMYNCAHSMRRHENYFDFFVANLFLTKMNTPMMYEMFPDYTPKTTPDKVLDYRPSLSEKLEKFPSAELHNLPELIALFNDLQKQAKAKPGKWVDGNIILGANPKEYFPSDEELLLSELGNTIESMVHTEQPLAIQDLLKKNKIKAKNLKFTSYTFLHVDVMGSGRFFYIANIEQKEIIFP